MKKSILLASVFALLSLVFSGCENFGDAGFKESLDKSIELAKAPKQRFTVAPLDVFDGNVTSNLSSAKIGEEFELSFTPDKNVYFVNWIAVDGDNNIIGESDIKITSTFSDKTKALVKINKEFENLRFIPWCIKRTGVFNEKPAFTLQAPNFRNSEIAGHTEFEDDFIINFDVNTKIYDLKNIIFNYDYYDDKINGSFESDTFTFDLIDKKGYKIDLSGNKLPSTDFEVSLNNYGEKNVYDEHSGELKETFTFYKLNFISKKALLSLNIQLDCIPKDECGIDESSGINICLTVADKGDVTKLVNAPKYKEFSLDGYKYGTGMLPSVFQNVCPFSYRVNSYARWQSQNYSWELKYTFETPEEIVDGDNITITENVFYLPKGTYLNKDYINSYISSQNAVNGFEVGDEGYQIFTYDGNFIGKNCTEERVSQNKNYNGYYIDYGAYNYYLDLTVGYSDDTWLEKEAEPVNGKYVYNVYQKLESHHTDHMLLGGVHQFVVTFRHSGHTYKEVFYVETTGLDYQENFGCNSYKLDKLISINPKELVAYSSVTERVSKNSIRIYRRPTSEDLKSYDGVNWNIVKAADGKSEYFNGGRFVVKINDDIFVKNCADGYVGEPGNNSDPILFYYDINNLNLPKELPANIEARYIDSYFASNYVCPKTGEDAGEYYDYVYKDTIMIGSSAVGNIVMINPKTGYVFDLDPVSYLHYDGRAEPIAVVAYVENSYISAVGLKNLPTVWTNIASRPFTLLNPTSNSDWFNSFYYGVSAADTRKGYLEKNHLKQLVGYGPAYAYFNVPSDYCTVSGSTITLGSEVHTAKYSNSEYVWYEPSQSEWRSIADNKSVVNESLALVGGDKLEGKYWTLYNWGYVNMDSSYITQYSAASSDVYNLRPTYNFYKALTGKDDIIDGVSH